MINKIISAINLHNGGGLSYLYLINNFLDNKNNLIILDYRVKSKSLYFQNAKVIFLKKGFLRNLRILWIRIKYQTYFYANRNMDDIKEKFFSEIFLNGIPPLFRLRNSKVMLFCQNKLIFKGNKLDKKSINSIKVSLNLFIQQRLFKIFLRDKDIIIVQTDSMLKLLGKKVKNKIILQKEVWGDFNSENLTLIKNKINNVDKYLLAKIKSLSSEYILFFYPASFYTHKNHINLLKAFDLLYKKNDFKFKLILTLEPNDLIFLNSDQKSYIYSLGSQQYENIICLYEFIDYLIYPSIIESYGLPLIEAKLNKKKIIASDLNYVFDVCNPDYTFNPFDFKDLYSTLYSILVKSKL